MINCCQGHSHERRYDPRGVGSSVIYREECVPHRCSECDAGAIYGLEEKWYCLEHYLARHGYAG